jgi:hypothetical protein
MYYGPLSNDELVRYNATVKTERKDTVTTRISIDHRGTTRQWDIEDDAEADRAAAAVIRVLNPEITEAPRTRRKFTPEQLQEIADAWHAAPEGHRNKAVRDLLGTSRQNATNYIHRCRAVGLIAPTAGRGRPDRTATKAASFSDEIERLLVHGGDS